MAEPTQEQRVSHLMVLTTAVGTAGAAPLAGPKPAARPDPAEPSPPRERYRSPLNATAIVPRTGAGSDWRQPCRRNARVRESLVAYRASEVEAHAQARYAGSEATCPDRGVMRARATHVLAARRRDFYAVRNEPSGGVNDLRQEPAGAVGHIVPDLEGLGACRAEARRRDHSVVKRARQLAVR